MAGYPWSDQSTSLPRLKGHEENQEHHGVNVLKHSTVFWMNLLHIIECGATPLWKGILVFK